MHISAQNDARNEWKTFTSEMICMFNSTNIQAHSKRVGRWLLLVTVVWSTALTPTDPKICLSTKTGLVWEHTHTHIHEMNKVFRLYFTDAVWSSECCCLAISLISLWTWNPFPELCLFIHSAQNEWMNESDVFIWRMLYTQILIETPPEKIA